MEKVERKKRNKKLLFKEGKSRINRLHKYKLKGIQSIYNKTIFFKNNGSTPIYNKLASMPTVLTVLSLLINSCYYIRCTFYLFLKNKRYFIYFFFFSVILQILSTNHNTRQLVFWQKRPISSHGIFLQVGGKYQCYTNHSFESCAETYKGYEYI